MYVCINNNLILVNASFLQDFNMKHPSTTFKLDLYVNREESEH